MDIGKLKGILDAIEAESKQPQPSHANLARLTHMALVETMNFLDMLCKGLIPLLVKKDASVSQDRPLPMINEPVFAIVPDDPEPTPAPVSDVVEGDPQPS